MADVARLFPDIPDDVMEPEDSVADAPLREAMRIAEALLFAATEPLDESEIARRMPEQVAVADVLTALREDYAGRGINLVRVGKKWLFRTASDLGWLLSRGEIEPKKLSRAALETLAIIAYHQPVTRAEIEDIRGVAISKGTLDVLIETGWVRLRGRRKAPGRPVTYGTTEMFLLHFGLEAIADLPGLDELKGAGMFDGRLPQSFAVPLPSDDPTLTDDEDPLEDAAAEDRTLEDFGAPDESVVVEETLEVTMVAEAIVEMEAADDDAADDSVGDDAVDDAEGEEIEAPDEDDHDEMDAQE